MSKNDVLDTVDIFFGAGKKTDAEEAAADKNKNGIPKEIADEIERLEAELPVWQAEAEKIVAARNKAQGKNAGPQAVKSAGGPPTLPPTRTPNAPLATGAVNDRASYPPIAEPELSGSAAAPQRGANSYPGGIPQPRQQVVETPERERISFVLPYEQVEFLKNYKYCRALMDGDPQYTLTEALTEAVELLRKHSEYEVFERPDFVRAREKKPRR